MILLKLDDRELTKFLQEFPEKAKRLIEETTVLLAQQTHAQIVEWANQELHSRREKYIAALQAPKAADHAATWVIELNPEASWIEEGIPQDFQMLEHLLRSPKTKTAKDGSRYRAIPFENNRIPTQLTGMKYARQMKDAVKKFLATKGIDMTKIEREPSGAARLGMLHSFDQFPGQMHPRKSHEGPGMGHGPMNSLRQGPESTGSRPFLSGLRVYQREVEDDKTKAKTVQRGVITFRNVSSKQNASELWVHPGLTPKRFFERAYDWAKKEWETVLIPALYDRLT